MSGLRSLMTAARTMGREECEALAKRALSFATADETRVTINSGGRGNTRFAVNQISTGGDNYDATVSVRSTFGKRSARREHEQAGRREPQVGRAARGATGEAIAGRSRGDAGARTADVRRAKGWSEATASLDPTRARQRARAITEPARAAGLISTGYLETQAGATAIANSKGLFAYNKQTALSLTTTVRTQDGTGSGWAGATSHDFTKLDPKDLGAARDRQGEAFRQSGCHRAGTLYRRSSSQPPSGISSSSSRTR